MSAFVYYAWHEQNIVRQGGSTPLYRNLRECAAYAKKGFDASDLLKIPDESDGWKRFETPMRRVINSSLDLPKRSYLSPFGKPAEEFTITILIDLDSAAMDYIDGNISIVPGLFFAGIGENWEVYFNGRLIVSEMHLDDTGQIAKRRTWRDVYFPLDNSLVWPGTNILALRIVGDPTYRGTGLFYAGAPIYMEDYGVIEGRRFDLLHIILCGIFAFTGVYYFLLFFSIKKRTEIFNLYFSIFSILLCIYNISLEGMVNILIPNSDISVRLEYGSLALAIPVLGIFIETLGMGKTTRISRVYLAVCLSIFLTQTFFCAQYGEEIISIWNVITLIYVNFILAYDVIYIHFWKRRKEKTPGNEAQDLSIGSILIGIIISYLCGIFDFLDILIFNVSIDLFSYSVFAVHIGMTFTLSQRFSGMYRRLEQSNTMLELAVHERTIELEKQTRIALNASRTKSEFLATMSHEIRTPLNAVLGLSEIELRRNLPEPSRENIVRIYQSGSSLLRIINDILDFSKIESGKLEIVPVKYLFSSLVNDAISIIRMRLMEKPLRFFTNIDGNIPNSLIGDEARLRQVILNLLSNAVKYSDKGHIGLTITIDRRDAARVWLKINVADTGKGIRPEDQAKLFSEFIQVDAKKNRGIEGTGLGLAITRRLCLLMGGDISMESEYGKGSEFTAVIPQEIESETPFALVEVPEKKKILVYEGRLVYAKSICWTLENFKVPYTMVTDIDDFADALSREEWFYVFSGYGLYDKIKPLMERDFFPKKKPSLALMIEWGVEAYIPDVRFVSIPIQSLSIANILNGKADIKDYVKSSDIIRFTFPRARLLVVDDIVTNLKVAEGLLAPYLAKVDACLSGARAVEMVKQAVQENREYDIVFMDHMMPEMDGIEAAALIRAWEKESGTMRNQIPIVALTANAVVGMREMFLEKGFNDFLTKPIDISKLDEMLKRWIPKEKREEGNRGPGIRNREDNSFVSAIPGVDMAKGIALTGGTDAGYRIVLSMFRKDAEDRLPLLQTAPDAESLPAFVTQVHALKSASASVGAAELSAEAAKLEAAGKAGDLSYIQTNLAAFVQSLSELSAGILVWEKTMKENDSEKQAATGGIDRVTALPLMRELAEALKLHKADDIDRVLEGLMRQPLDAVAKTAVEQISNEVLMAEYDKAGVILENLFYS
ncbi:MAG: response regulator [Treponema sp.]|nr:response regulator [Treponema sp.]